VLSSPFVLLTKSRSGSKWLVELLDGHPELAVYGELFGGAQVRLDYGAQGMPRFDAHLDEGGALRRLLPREVSRARYLRKALASKPDARAVGVKLVYSHATRAILTSLAARRGRVIHLIRSNMLDAVVSYEVAAARQVFGARAGQPLAPVTISFDGDALRKRLEEHAYQISRGQGMLLRYRLPTLEVFYEELVGRHDETIERILDFLGVDRIVEPLRSTFAPSDDAPLDELVSNLAEVEAALAGTRFEWMLGARRPSCTSRT
jgi:LPS sulfotransferase NodH